MRAFKVTTRLNQNLYATRLQNIGFAVTAYQPRNHMSQPEAIRDFASCGRCRHALGLDVCKAAFASTYFRFKWWASFVMAFKSPFILPYHAYGTVARGNAHLFLKIRPLTAITTRNYSTNNFRDCVRIWNYCFFFFKKYTKENDIKA